MSDKILIVDDDVALAKTIETILVGASYKTFLAFTAEDGIRLALSKQPDLVLLDVMVPNMGGWAACQKLREASDVPIIFLTALGNVENVVRGLEMGADDYMVKPFIEAEFLARIKAHLRRTKPQTKPLNQLTFGDGELVVDLPSHRVIMHGNEVSLTPREFELLSVLVCNAGQVLPTAELVSRAWGLNDKEAVDNIKPYIHYLRKKIEADSASPRWIQTVRGVGYRFADE